jgi:hypothetical protein
MSMHCLNATRYNHSLEMPTLCISATFSCVHEYRVPTEISVLLSGRLLSLSLLSQRGHIRVVSTILKKK